MGYSYGTFLGSTYASLFPDNVGRMVLDGAMDPSLSYEELTSGQAKAFEKALRAYVAHCLQAGGCPLSGSVGGRCPADQGRHQAVEANPLPAKDGRHGLGVGDCQRHHPARSTTTTTGRSSPRR